MRRAKYSHDMMRLTLEQPTNGHPSLCILGTMLATHVCVAGAKALGMGNGTMTMPHDTSAITQPRAALGVCMICVGPPDQLPQCLTSQRSSSTPGPCAIRVRSTSSKVYSNFWEDFPAGQMALTPVEEHEHLRKAGNGKHSKKSEQAKSG